MKMKNNVDSRMTYGFVLLSPFRWVFVWVWVSFCFLAAPFGVFPLSAGTIAESPAGFITSYAEFPDTVIGFGDSVTQGYPYIMEPGDGRRVGGYQTRLEELIRSDRSTTTVLNYGYAGEGTKDGLNRLSGVIEKYSGACILLLEGTNDVWYGISHQTTIQNLGKMIDQCLNAGMTPILSTITPDTRSGMESVKQISSTYNPAILSLADEKGIALCDQYTALSENWKSLNSDGIHPNTSGYQTMAETWYETIRQISTDPEPQPLELKIQANLQDDFLVIPSETPLLITTSLSAGDMNGVAADWWWTVLYQGFWVSMVIPDGWVGGFYPLVQSPLFSFSEFPLFYGNLEPGEYFFCFVVDTIPNGILDWPFTADFVQVWITESP
jgi:lysophospholipase L1-like esterase